MKRLLILCNLFAISKQITNLCERTGELVCCPGFVRNSTGNTCIPCQDGYFGFDCLKRCPPSFFGRGCASKCNCSDEQCHHVNGCGTPQSRLEKETTTVPSARVPQNDPATVTSGHWIIGESTGSSTRHSLENNTVPIGVSDISAKHRLNKCSHNRKHLRIARSVLFTISACFTAISGLFLVLYFGLDVYKFKLQADHPPAV